MQHTSSLLLMQRETKKFVWTVSTAMVLEHLFAWEDTLEICRSRTQDPVFVLNGNSRPSPKLPRDVPRRGESFRGTTRGVAFTTGSTRLTQSILSLCPSWSTPWVLSLINIYIPRFTDSRLFYPIRLQSLLTLHIIVVFLHICSTPAYSSSPFSLVPAPARTDLDAMASDQRSFSASSNTSHSDRLSSERRPSSSSYYRPSSPSYRLSPLHPSADSFASGASIAAPPPISPNFAALPPVPPPRIHKCPIP